MENQRLNEIRAEIARRKKAQPAPSNSESSNSRLEQVRAEIAKRKQASNSEESKNPDFNWNRFLGERLAQGAFSLGDFAQLLSQVNPMADYATNYQEPPLRTVGNLEAEQLSETANKEFKEVGVDLQSQGKGNTPGQRIVGAAVSSVPSAILGGPTGFFKNMATAGTIGGVSQGLQEVNTHPLVADIISILGTSFGRNLLAKLLSPKSAVTLNEAETRVANAIKSQMTEDEINNVVKNIEKDQPNKITGYEPLTAEVADSPAVSQIHRVRQPVASSGIGSEEGAEHNKLVQAFQERELSPISSGELQNELKNELAKRVETRRSATSGGYEKVEKNLNYAQPKNTEKALRSSIAKGSIKADLNSIKKDIMPAFGQPAPTIAELWATKKALNSKIGARKKAGMDANVAELNKIKEALLKDLEKDPLIRETDKLYRELSIPIDEIKKHPKLKQLLKSRSNNIVSDLFDKHSHDNAIALKKALGNHEAIWSSIEDATVKKVREAISNISSKGASRELSYSKYEEFMKKHEGALKEIFTKDQIDLLEETGKILKGQNSDNTKGRALGSPTQANIRNEKDLKNLLGISEEEMSGMSAKSLGLKAAQFGFAQIPYAGKKINAGIDLMLSKWAQNNENKLMRLVDKFLKDKEFAAKLLTYKDKPQVDVNRFLNRNLYKISATSSFKEDNKEKD